MGPQLFRGPIGQCPVDVLGNSGLNAGTLAVREHGRATHLTSPSMGVGSDRIRNGKCRHIEFGLDLGMLALDVFVSAIMLLC